MPTLVDCILNVVVSVVHILLYIAAMHPQFVRNMMKYLLAVDHDWLNPFQSTLVLVFVAIYICTDRSKLYRLLI